MNKNRLRIILAGLCLSLLMPVPRIASAGTISQNATLLAANENVVQIFNGRKVIVIDLTYQNTKLSLSNGADSDITKWIAGDKLSVRYDETSKPEYPLQIVNLSIDPSYRLIQGKVVSADFQTGIITILRASTGLNQNIKLQSGVTVGYPGGRKFSHRYLKSGDKVKLYTRTDNGNTIANRILVIINKYSHGAFDVPTTCSFLSFQDSNFRGFNGRNASAAFFAKPPLVNSRISYRNHNLGIIDCTKVNHQWVDITGQPREHVLDVERMTLETDTRVISGVRGKVVSINPDEKVFALKYGAKFINVRMEPQSSIMDLNQNNVGFSKIKVDSDLTVFAVEPTRDNVFPTLIRVNHF